MATQLGNLGRLHTSHAVIPRSTGANPRRDRQSLRRKNARALRPEQTAHGTGRWQGDLALVAHNSVFGAAQQHPRRRVHGLPDPEGFHRSSERMVSRNAHFTSGKSERAKCVDKGASTSTQTDTPTPRPSTQRASQETQVRRMNQRTTRTSANATTLASVPAAACARACTL